jgi:hypothetical protein
MASNIAWDRWGILLPKVLVSAVENIREFTPAEIDAAIMSRYESKMDWRMEMSKGKGFTAYPRPSRITIREVAQTAENPHDEDTSEFHAWEESNMNVTYKKEYLDGWPQLVYGQMWLANVGLRHDAMILDLWDFDNKPEPLDSGEQLRSVTRVVGGYDL